jgi:translocator protein
MTEIASRGQLRWEFVRTVIIIVPLVLLIGGLSSKLTGADVPALYAALNKPPAAPPGWMFGLVWTVLYILMGIAAAIVWHAVGHRLRWPALSVFTVQLILNFSWSPMFFGAGLMWPAAGVVALLLVLAGITTWMFFQIRKTAGWLLVPYLVWLCMALYLNIGIAMRNPDGLPDPSAGSDVGLSVPFGGE